ncbi:AAA family ATPase [Okibacterium fritillariae]|uniref:AAA family ATPase n=1 Tax=Okibacterium fritillariae TaxID=123320 RepID=UPI004055420D
MKINALTFAGIGPYKAEQHIDFDALEDDGIYLISGKTGAGKSTILDAICFALYNAVPRFDGGPSQTRLRSDYCAPEDPSFVTLEFSVHGDRYRVTRTPEYVRPAKRGGGLTTQKQTAVLERLDAGEWRGIAARPVDVFPEIDRIVGLNKDQFLQVILLAQNRFQEFLLAKNDDRLQVLRSLFGTRRFGDLEQNLADRRAALKGEVEALGDTLRRLADRAVATATFEDDAIEDDAIEDDTVEVDDTDNVNDLIDVNGAAVSPPAEPLSAPAEPDSAWFDRAARSLAPRVASARAALDQATRELDEAEGRVSDAKDVARRQTRRADAAATLERLGEQAADIVTRRARLAAHERAHALWSLLDGVDSADADVSRARGRLADATKALLADAGAADALDDGALDDGALDDEAVNVKARVAEAPVVAAVDVPTAERVGRLVDELNRTLGEMSEALRDEERAVTLAAELATAEERLQDIDARASELRARLDVLPEMQHDLRAQRDAARLTAARRDDLSASVDDLARKLEAARAGERAEQAAAAALRAEADAVSEHARAAGELSDLFSRRLNGDAAHLAAQLEPGEPCAVCGSREHPQPAAADGEAVTDEALDEGRARVERADQISKKAAHRRRAADDEVAALKIASTGRTPDELSQDLDGETAALKAAEAARAEAAKLDRDIERLDTEYTDAAAASEQLHLERAVVADTLAGLKSRLAEARDRVTSQRGSFDTVAERAESIRQTVSVAARFLTTAESAEGAEQALEQARAAVARALADSDFSSLDELRAAHLEPGEQAAHAATVRQHDAGLAAAEATLAEPELQGVPAEPVDVGVVSEERDRARERVAHASDVHAAMRERQRTLDAIVAEATATLHTGGEQLAAYNTIRGLANAVEGKEPNDKRMHLEAYVLAAELEEIIAAANARLHTMTSGRFRLEHDDSRAYRGASSGLGLAIRDEYTGRARATASLSGGETFLASLALALGLAEIVTSRAGGITLETLFVDEGFGSLDRETLDITLSTLDSLRTGGRTVGLISHVDAMKEQIPSRLRITSGPTGASTVRQDAVISPLDSVAGPTPAERKTAGA